MARFASEIHESLRNPEPADVAIVTSQAAQFSAIREMQIAAQRNAVRAAAYVAKMPVSVIAANQVGKMGAPKLAILPSAQALADSTWDALLAYVKSGGNLLITGPVERDAHWHRVNRAATVGLDDAKIESLTVHSAEMTAKGETIPLSFGFDAQTWLETFQFKDGQQLKELAVGNGHIFWAPYPVELAEGEAAPAKLYSAVFSEIGLRAPFELKSAPAPGVLIYPTALQDSVLYVMVSERDQDYDLDLVDSTSKGELKLRLPTEHAAMALIRKSDGSITAKYGF